PLHLLHQRDERGIEVSHQRRRHGAQHARMHGGGTGAEEQAIGGFEGVERGGHLRVSSGAHPAATNRRRQAPIAERAASTIAPASCRMAGSRSPSITTPSRPSAPP